MRGLILLSFAVACGGEPDTNADDAATGVDARRDAGVTETRINGVMYGMPFTLRYASIKRETPSDAYNWVCVADVPVTYDQCSMTGAPTA